MPSAIEHFLYGAHAAHVSAHGAVGNHEVAELSVAEKLVRLRIACCDAP